VAFVKVCKWEARTVSADGCLYRGRQSSFEKGGGLFSLFRRLETGNFAAEPKRSDKKRSSFQFFIPVGPQSWTPATFSCWRPEKVKRVLLFHPGNTRKQDRFYFFIPAGPESSTAATFSRCRSEKVKRVQVFHPGRTKNLTPLYFFNTAGPENRTPPTFSRCRPEKLERVSIFHRRWIKNAG
jgi:hypothetical protein